MGILKDQNISGQNRWYDDSDLDNQMNQLRELEPEAEVFFQKALNQVAILLDGEMVPYSYKEYMESKGVYEPA